MKDLDQQIKKAFDKQITDQIEPIQNEVWQSIDSQLFQENNQKGKVRTMKKNKTMFAFSLASAAILLMMISLTTAPGTAFVAQIKDLFTPEKDITQSIEGQEEQTHVNLNEGTNVDYILYIDESRYKMDKSGNVDIITTIDPLPDRYPTVSLEIRQIVDQLPDEVVKELAATLQQDFPQLRPVENVTEPVEGFLLHGIDGQEPTSKVVHAYVISNKKGGSFILQGNYFLEAAEGHGARFQHMLESFTIVEE